tara:strand:+ start:195 stop:479 length:285 start_codon:yes stop_codon:yes gene_type:complete
MVRRDLSKPLAESFFDKDKPKRKAKKADKQAKRISKLEKKKAAAEKRDTYAGDYKAKRIQGRIDRTTKRQDNKELSPKDRKHKRKVEKWMKKNM